jgi:hypothetical protein
MEVNKGYITSWDQDLEFDTQQSMVTSLHIKQIRITYLKVCKKVVQAKKRSWYTSGSSVSVFQV